MKIGISCYPVYGGSGVVATELGIQLARRGHEVHFITYAQPFRLPCYLENVYFHAVEVPSYPLIDHPPYSLALAAAMHRTAEQRQLDLLHVHYAVPHATSAWIAREMSHNSDLRVITTLHGTDITLVGQDPSFHSITKFSITQSDGITAVSEYLRRQTVAHFDVSPDSIVVIPNFVDLEQFNREKQPCHRSRFATPEEKILIHVSNFRPVKRVPDVIRVFASVAGEIPARMLLVGDGPERGRAELTASQLGIADRVEFLGKQDSVAELLSCADLLVMGSESESFGLAALEAMACGVPVVCTEVGGVPELLDKGGGASLSAVGDIQGMASAALDYLADHSRWSKASRDARRTAERFGTDRVIPLYERYYDLVLGERL